MGDLTLILVGALLVSIGWLWGGVTDSRTTAVAAVVPAAMLLGITVFTASSAPDTPTWAFAAISAVWAGLFAATTRWEVSDDRTLGLFSLFVAITAGLVAGGLINADEELTVTSLGVIVSAGAAVLVFISGALIPSVRAFRNFAGWALLILGAATTFLGLATSLDVTL